MNWLYRFTTNPNFPDPIQEIDAIITLDDSGEKTYLLLADRKGPPLSGALPGDIIGLCTGDQEHLYLHGTAVVVGNCINQNTPLSVVCVYGNLEHRTFCPLGELNRFPSNILPEPILNFHDQRKFLSGQSYVKKLTLNKLSLQNSKINKTKKNPTNPLGIPPILTSPKVTLKSKLPHFTVVGLDPTAGTWESKMKNGPKQMPSFVLEWDGNQFTAPADPIKWHISNECFWNLVNEKSAKMICIDGPNKTNGPNLENDRDNLRWNPLGRDGIRAGELALSRAGVNLFWTTQNTVMKFDGASRWIARSLVLFSEMPKQSKIETHPHCVFTFLWKMFGHTDPLPKKSKPLGRQARLGILKSFIPNLTEDLILNHDAVDAACAALVAGLHLLELTKSFGSEDEGGFIIMPNIDRLAEVINQ